jgi:diguanylate cyclase (GGDEF)-like protein
VVLKKIAELLRNSFRQSDTAGRYGGEEFVLILPEMDIETAGKKVDSLRELVATTPIAIGPQGQNVQVTISAGVASFPQDGESAAELFAAADERMFEAKGEGRNRVVAGRETILA